MWFELHVALVRATVVENWSKLVLYLILDSIWTKNILVSKYSKHISMFWVTISMLVMYILLYLKVKNYILTECTLSDQFGRFPLKYKRLSHLLKCCYCNFVGNLNVLIDKEVLLVLISMIVTLLGVKYIISWPMVKHKA